MRFYRITLMKSVMFLNIISKDWDTQSKKCWVREDKVIVKMTSCITKVKCASGFPLMTVLPETTSCLLLLLLLVELPVLAMPHPGPMRHHKEGLTKLFQKMRRLINIVQETVVSLMWFLVLFYLSYESGANVLCKSAFWAFPGAKWWLHNYY